MSKHIAPAAPTREMAAKRLTAVERELKMSDGWARLSPEQRSAYCVALAVLEPLALDDDDRARAAAAIKVHVLALTPPT